MKVLIFQHTPEEKPGTLLDWMRARRHSVKVHPWYVGASVPSAIEFDWLIVLGGPMNLDQEAEYPWLLQEKVYIRSWLETGKPLLGICLGGQLLSQSLGGRITRNPEREIGFHKINKTGAVHPALAQWPETLPVYQYHEDTFSIPSSAVGLLESPACANQAFAVGKKILGLQFHPESTAEWIMGNASSVEINPGERWVQAPAETSKMIADFLPPMTEAFFHLLDDFVNSWET
jgi:GMP synthase-like glutamine amidotransferase